MPQGGDHIFLSYSRNDKAQVAKLRESLIAAGEAVWWDEDILPGADWKYEVRLALQRARAVILCLSQHATERAQSGIYPEISNSIARYREYAPGGIFLIPVRLDDCEIPPIEIDAVRSLDQLQYVDFFEGHDWGDPLKRLRAALGHPGGRPQ